MDPRLVDLYARTRFCLEAPIARWPERFALITGYATTGETWSAERNEAADRALLAELRPRTPWLTRITGYDPSPDDPADPLREPGWAVVLPFDATCDLGRRFLQTAIYWVDGDELSASYCDERRGLVGMGSFRERLDTGRCPAG